MNSIPLVDIAYENYRGRIPAGFISLGTGGVAVGDCESCLVHFETAAHDDTRAACDIYGRNKRPDVVNAHSGFDLGTLEY